MSKKGSLTVQKVIEIESLQVVLRIDFFFIFVTSYFVKSLCCRCLSADSSDVSCSRRVAVSRCLNEMFIELLRASSCGFSCTLDVIFFCARFCLECFERAVVAGSFAFSRDVDGFLKFQKRALFGTKFPTA